MTDHWLILMIVIDPWLIDQPFMIMIVSMGIDHFDNLIDVLIDALRSDQINYQNIDK